MRKASRLKGIVLTGLLGILPGNFDSASTQATVPPPTHSSEQRTPEIVSPKTIEEKIQAGWKLHLTAQNQGPLDTYLSTQTDIAQLIANGDAFLEAGANRVKRIPYTETDTKYRIRSSQDIPVDKKHTLYNLVNARARYEKALELSLVNQELERMARNKLLVVLQKLFTLPKGEIDEHYRSYVYISLTGNLTRLRVITSSYQERLTYDKWINDIAPKVP